MKIHILASGILMLALQAHLPKDLLAQTPEELQPSATGVSDLFRNYASQNPLISAASADDVEIRNQLTIPRGAGSLTSPPVGASIAAAP